MSPNVDWQFEAAAVQFGAGTDIRVPRPPAGPGPVGLLGTGATRANHPPRARDHGVAPTRITYGPRLVTIPIQTLGDGSTETARTASAWAKARPLLDVWVPDGTEQTLDYRVPGSPEQVMRLHGQFLDVLPSGWGLTEGHQRWDLDFLATDPFAYGAAQNQSGTSPQAITVAGNQPTRRATIALTGNGSTAVLTIGSAVVRVTITNTETWTVDLLNWRVLDASGDVAAETLVDSEWPTLGPGATTITCTNVTDIDVTWRPAWSV